MTEILPKAAVHESSFILLINATNEDKIRLELTYSAQVLTREVSGGKAF
jgi:hypothetical protein